MTAEQQAHEYATQVARAYASKFTRPVAARAVDHVYVAAFRSFMRKAAA